MTDTTEVEKWTLLHGELVREDDGPLVWSADYNLLAAKLAEVEADTHKIMVAYATAHAAVLGVAQAMEDAYRSRGEKNDD